MLHVKLDKRTRSFDFGGKIINVAQTDFRNVWTQTSQHLRKLDPEEFPRVHDLVAVWVYIGTGIGPREPPCLVGCSWYKCPTVTLTLLVYAKFSHLI
jgi:hypothetical protein